ncbi:hypothetical protein B0H11DRAFT_2185995 [Mycena galericulata]|nr:hypothetical protein B0H11DRAFT_2185995 [Mycena galericulata]
MDDLFSVRLADHADIAQITDIVNHYIQSSVATFRTDTLAEAAILETYLSIRGQGHPYIVAVASDSQTILGYAYASGYRMPSHKAYSHTHLTRGVGSALMSDLLLKLKDPVSLRGWALSNAPEVTEVLCIMAVDVSARDHGYGLRDWYTRWGFEEVGHLKRVGFKFGIWIDTLILQLSLPR